MERTFGRYGGEECDGGVLLQLRQSGLHVGAEMDPPDVPDEDRGTIAVGADGLIVEVHHQPDQALSDGIQSLYPEQFDDLMAQVRLIAPVVGRTVPGIGNHGQSQAAVPQTSAASPAAD